MKNEKNRMRLLLPLAAALLLAGFGTGTAHALQYPNPYPSPGMEAPAQTVIVATAADVIVTYNGAEGAIPAQLYLDDPVNGFGIIFDNQTSQEGDSFNLGSFPVGTELIFELYVANGPGYYFQTGSGNRNFEGLVHAYVTQDYPLSGETWAGFEDLDGGGDFDYDDFTFYVSNTTAEPVPPPVLDNYPNASVTISGNTTITPNAAPTDTTRINVSTSTDFKGRLQGDPATGIVRVTDAHPAGTYTVTVTAFNGSGVTATETFTLTVTTPVTCNPVGFSTPNAFPVGQYPQAEAVGDFDGDGNQDLVAASALDNNVSVMLGDGTGGFSLPTDFSTGSFPDSVVVGDFNGDGFQDLVIGNYSSGDVTVLLGDGSGGFSATPNFGTANNPESLAMGDFNNDGKQDLAAADGSSANVSVLLGNGLGGFGSGNLFATGTSPQFSRGELVVVGDFNGDGNQDLATANLGSGDVSVLLGDGTGNFSSAVNFPVGNELGSLVVGNFNGDGFQDLAIANADDDTVAVMLGDGTGGFSLPTTFGVSNRPQSVAVGDFDGDGNQDLVTGNESIGDVSVLLGDGLGNFGPATNFLAGRRSVVVGDFNGDGLQDLATADEVLHNVTVILRQCASPTPTPTPTPPPLVSISGTILYCSNPVPGPVPNVTLTRTGTTSGSTLSAGNGTYTFSSLPSGGNYTVTPSKAALAPGSTGISGVDAIAVQRHFLVLGTPLAGCRLTAADVNGIGGVDGIDAIAIQRFFLGFTSGIANVGKYRFTPLNRSYVNLASNQTGQNYDTLIFGDTASSFAERVDGPPPSEANDGTNGDVRAPVAMVTLPNAELDASVTDFLLQVTTTTIDAGHRLVGFQGDFTFDERVAAFKSEPVRKAGLTGGNWNVLGNVLPGTGPIRTLRISAYSNDFTALSGSGTLFELRMTRVSKAAPSTQLIWATPPNQFIFIDADLNTQQPGYAAPGGVTSSGKRK